MRLEVGPWSLKIARNCTSSSHSYVNLQHTLIGFKILTNGLLIFQPAFIAQMGDNSISTFMLSTNHKGLTNESGIFKAK